MISHSRFLRPYLAITFTILFLVHCGHAKPSIPVHSKMSVLTKPPIASYVLLIDKKTVSPSPAPSPESQSSKAPSWSPSSQSTTPFKAPRTSKAKSHKQKKVVTKGQSKPKAKETLTGGKGKGSPVFKSTKAPERGGKGSTKKGSTKSPSQEAFSQSLSSNMSASIPQSAAVTLTFTSHFSVLLLCIVPCYFLM